MLLRQRCRWAAVMLVAGCAGVVPAGGGGEGGVGGAAGPELAGEGEGEGEGASDGDAGAGAGGDGVDQRADGEFEDQCSTDDECASRRCMDGFCSRGCRDDEDCRGRVLRVCVTLPDTGADRETACVRIDRTDCRPCLFSNECGGYGRNRCVDRDGNRACATFCLSEDDCAVGFSCEQATDVDGLTASVCTLAGGCPACQDGDGDRFGEGAECDGPDCDDTRADVHPGAFETCDGVDEDCDGDVDEGFGVGGECDGEDSDRCAFGRLVCSPGGDEAVCGPEEIEDIEEVCDGLDNDCDGVPDNGPGMCPDGQACVEGRCVGCDPEREICDGVDNDCDDEVDEDFAVGEPCAVGDGVCEEAGRLICTAARDDVRCDAEPGAAAAEACNGLDDDCDGVVDNVLGVGDACVAGRGACEARGELRCAPDGGAPQCSAAPGPAGGEQCNGLDDDCDGAVDNVAGLGDECVVGRGACEARGQLQCAPGNRAPQCSVAPGAGERELCNGRDDDCDGQIDNGLGLGNECVVGRGACERRGRLRCAGDGVNTECDIAPGEPGVERCNGGDDNCDGRVDEDLDCATPDGSLRLVGGGDGREGRVEILHDGRWGTICDDRWEVADAQVVCRQLGLPFGDAEAFGNARFGQGRDPIWLDDVGCGGAEARLDQCGHPGWGVHNCGHREDASVRCADPPPPPHPCDAPGVAREGVNQGVVRPAASQAGPDDCGGGAGPEVALRFQAPRQGLWSFDTGGSQNGYDTVLYLRSDCRQQRSELECNDDAGGRTTSRLELDLNAGQTVYVFVDGFGQNDAGSWTLTIETVEDDCDDVDPCNGDDDDCDGDVDEDANCGAGRFCARAGRCVDEPWERNNIRPSTHFGRNGEARGRVAGCQRWPALAGWHHGGNNVNDLPFWTYASDCGVPANLEAPGDYPGFYARYDLDVPYDDEYIIEAYVPGRRCDHDNDRRSQQVHYIVDNDGGRNVHLLADQREQNFDQWVRLTGSIRLSASGNHKLYFYDDAWGGMCCNDGPNCVGPNWVYADHVRIVRVAN